MTEVVPRIVATPPGPKTTEILARQERVLYPGLAHDLGPFVINRKAGWQVEDVDGNVYLDFISAMASVPFGAARPDVVEPVIEACMSKMTLCASPLRLNNASWIDGSAYQNGMLARMPAWP